MIPFPYYDKMIYDKYFDGNPIPMHKLHPSSHYGVVSCPSNVFCVWPYDRNTHTVTVRSVREYTPDYIENLIKI